MKLTERDYAEISKIWTEPNYPMGGRNEIDATYVAGYRAGLEAAAKLCATKAAYWQNLGMARFSKPYSIAGASAEELMDAIRALDKPEESAAE